MKGHDGRSQNPKFSPAPTAFTEHRAESNNGVRMESIEQIDVAIVGPKLSQRMETENCALIACISYLWYGIRATAPNRDIMLEAHQNTPPNK